jgi:hypothetical protein
MKRESSWKDTPNKQENGQPRECQRLNVVRRSERLDSLEPTFLPIREAPSQPNERAASPFAVKT